MIFENRINHDVETTLFARRWLRNGGGGAGCGGAAYCTHAFTAMEAAVVEACGGSGRRRWSCTVVAPGRRLWKSVDGYLPSCRLPGQEQELCCSRIHKFVKIANLLLPPLEVDLSNPYSLPCFKQQLMETLRTTEPSDL
ncbi:hypothetical protein E3N88_04207 [Mikania micrantha]|uniref:Uncharacterized protein n=1 Tax=Mikania micrantha TaxID=192012 RepID=A0A5N6PTS4_9ASTR|nr:hypothetical protein E3N88_04207 [Mikania micrantha]